MKIIHESCEDGVEKLSHGMNVCHNSASLNVPTCDPQDRSFYPTLPSMTDSYNLL